MTGQIDIGWAAPPFGLKEIKEGKIRIVARGSDVPSLRGQTVRAIIVNADALKTKKDAIMRFVDGYREAVDWMYADPQGGRRCTRRRSRQPKTLLQGVDQGLPARRKRCRPTRWTISTARSRDAVKLKFLDKPLTKEQLAEFLQIPPRK